MPGGWLTSDLVGWQRCPPYPDRLQHPAAIAYHGVARLFGRARPVPRSTKAGLTRDREKVWAFLRSRASPPKLQVSATAPAARRITSPAGIVTQLDTELKRWLWATCGCRRVWHYLLSAAWDEAPNIG